MLGGRHEMLDEMNDLEKGRWYRRVLSETSHSLFVSTLLQHLRWFGCEIWVLPFGKILSSGN